MKNYLQLEIGDQVRGLKFNMRTLDFIQQLTGKDPFTFRAASNDFKDVKEYALVIFHAALLSNCASKKEEPDFKAEEVAEWFHELNPSDVWLIVNTLSEPVETPANGEVSKDTQ